MDAVKVPDGNDSRSEVLGDFGGIVPDVDHQPRLFTADVRSARQPPGAGTF
ncbi:hypothetical protein D3C84_1262070 [compost metagenome]